MPKMKYRRHVSEGNCNECIHERVCSFHEQLERLAMKQDFSIQFKCWDHKKETR